MVNTVIIEEAQVACHYRLDMATLPFHLDTLTFSGNRLGDRNSQLEQIANAVDPFAAGAEKAF